MFSKWIKSALILISTTLIYSHASAEGDHFMNVRISPIGPVINYWNLDVDFRINDHWTVGPTATYFSIKFSGLSDYPDDIKVTAWAAGVRTNWYKEGVFKEGMYASGMLRAIGAKAEGRDITGSNNSADVTVGALAVMAGYHWFWESFNLNLGGGLEGILGNPKVNVKSSTGTNQEDVHVRRGGSVGLAVDFMIGWAF